MPPIYHVELVRRDGAENIVLATSEQAAVIIAKHLEKADREHFVVLMLDSVSRVIGINTVAVGTLLTAKIAGREVFKPAILANSASIIVGHNHPSGDTAPSQSDLDMTALLSQAGHVLDIELIDHIIVGDGGMFTSLRRNGYL